MYLESVDYRDILTLISSGDYKFAIGHVVSLSITVRKRKLNSRIAAAVLCNILSRHCSNGSLVATIYIVATIIAE